MGWHLSPLDTLGPSLAVEMLGTGVGGAPPESVRPSALPSSRHRGVDRAVLIIGTGNNGHPHEGDGTGGLNSGHPRQSDVIGVHLLRLISRGPVGVSVIGRIRGLGARILTVVEDTGRRRKQNRDKWKQNRSWFLHTQCDTQTMRSVS